MKTKRQLEYNLNQLRENFDPKKFHDLIVDVYQYIPPREQGNFLHSLKEASRLSEDYLADRISRDEYLQKLEQLVKKKG